MANSAERFDEILAKVERRERAARRRALLYSLVPVAMGLIVLGYTAHRIQTAAAEVRTLEQRLAETNAKLKEAEEKLSKAADLAQFAHPINFKDVKMIGSRFPSKAHILREIWELREEGVGWPRGGQSPGREFYSPHFAAFILHRLNLVPAGASNGTNVRERLLERFPSASSPRVGDLVFYPHGYVLFYFEDVRQQPFVIGMTPFGVTSLKPDFAEPLAYRRLPD